MDSVKGFLFNMVIGKKTGIYKITNPKGSVYIGQSRNISKRFTTYKTAGVKNQGQPKLYNSLKKYGSYNHVFEVIQECELSELNIMERYWQEYYNACDRGNLNCTLTSIDETPSIVSDETRKKQSDAAKIRMKRLLQCPKYLATMKESYRKRIGVKIAPRTNKQREAKRQVELAKGSWVGSKNPNYKNGKPGELNPMWGRKHSEETIKKIADKATDRKHSEKSKTLMSKQRSMGGNVKAKLVLNIDTGIYFDCCKEAWLSQSKLAYTTIKSKVNGSVRNDTPFRYV